MPPSRRSPRSLRRRSRSRRARQLGDEKSAASGQRDRLFGETSAQLDGKIPRPPGRAARATTPTRSRRIVLFPLDVLASAGFVPPYARHAVAAGPERPAGEVLSALARPYPSAPGADRPGILDFLRGLPTWSAFPFLLESTGGKGRVDLHDNRVGEPGWHQPGEHLSNRKGDRQ